MMDQTVREAKFEKAVLERKIELLLKEFADRNHCVVDDIDIATVTQERPEDEPDQTMYVCEVLASL
jgi:hypothetical protein